MVRVNDLIQIDSADVNVGLFSIAWANTGATKKLTLLQLAQIIYPIGALMPWAASGGSDPPGWVYCDGSAISRTSYPKLFAAIGTTWGAGDGSTTFNVPDLRCRTLVGEGNVPGVGSHNVGQTGGSETHTLTTAQIPAHAHGIAGGGFFMGINGAGAYGFGAGANGAVAQGLTTTIGSGQAHNNMQPYAAIKWLIRADF